jgi:MerC mercury resistance protein
MNPTVASPSSAHIDVVGTCLSRVCALHCLILPLLMAVLPSAGAGVLLEVAGGPVHHGVAFISFH